MSNPKVEVGDVLYFDSGSHINTSRVVSITPSGRIKTKGYVLNPDLTIRGLGSYPRCYKAELPTEELTSRLRSRMHYCV